MGGVLGAKSDCQKEVSDGSPDVRRRGPRPSRRERWALSPPVPSSATAASGNPWAAYRPGAAGAVAGEADVHGDPGRYISYRLRERVRRLGLEGAELAALGALRFSDQFLRVEEMEAVAGLSGRGPLAGGGGAGFRRPPPPNGRDSAVAPGSYSGGYGWVDDDEEMEEDKFWWHGETERLCFDLPITEEEYLTEGAPEIQQWWDVSKVAESEHYIAVAKPAGMFVVTDERGLWEESPTNFVHVTHRRFDIATKNEPRQRGICHRLDSHTSGIQIVGKSWESFRHFMAKNTRHKVQKEYIALVEGKLGHGGAPCPDDPGFGLVDVPMWKYQDQTRREFGSVFCASQGLPAVTKYRALRQWRVPATGALKFWGRDRWFTLVQLRILTGRTHQIRMHMAFTGHPLVGDMKYSPNLVEEDAAVVPRIFLHCLRMEFEDRDGSTFVAASDLAPDLRAVLCRLQRLSAEAEAEAPVPPPAEAGAQAEVVPATAAQEQDSEHLSVTGFPSLARILEESEKQRVDHAFCPQVTSEAHVADGVASGEASGVPTSTDGASAIAAESTGAEGKVAEPRQRAPNELRFRCRLCGCAEVAKYTLVKRGDRAAMTWRLERDQSSEAADDAGDAAKASALRPAAPSDGWGVGPLWVPTALQDAGAGSSPDGAEYDAAVDDKFLAELGVWGDEGAEWNWAHDGSRVNGWIRLLPEGILATRWGRGSWRLLPVPSDAAAPPPEEEAQAPAVPPLLLATFGTVEHCLRYTRSSSSAPTAGGDVFFEVVSVRRLANGQASVAEDPGTGAHLLPDAEPACPTRGWPGTSTAEVRGGGRPRDAAG
eukprot:TRINITY_DN28159_c0_g1_i12.p1 TRINITY_DN28159_c0_g1~~TRINITY_DN28159_c0_g1_i12.p1  ORF type:complete len:824 (-),score=179.38 TRINITY_DN28159_c0_g1_i12:384-2855(-)